MNVVLVIMQYRLGVSCLPSYCPKALGRRVESSRPILASPRVLDHFRLCSETLSQKRQHKTKTQSKTIMFPGTQRKVNIQKTQSVLPVVAQVKMRR